MFSCIYFIMLLNNHVGRMMYVSSQGDGLVDRKQCGCGLGVIRGYSILNHPIQKYTAYCSVFVHSVLCWTKTFLEVFCFWYFFHLLVCRREWSQMMSLPKITTGLAHKSHRHTHTYHIMVHEDSLYSYYLIYVIFMFRSWRSRWYKYTVNRCHLLDKK